MKNFYIIIAVLLLGIVTCNALIKCNYSVLVKVECHTSDCEGESTTTNGDCNHCIIFKTVVVHTKNMLKETPSSYTSYFITESKYSFLDPNSIYHPPRL